MAIHKETALKYIDSLIVFFLCMGFITSQVSIASSSIGVGVSLGLTIIRLIIDRNVHFGDKTIIYLFMVFILLQIISSALSVHQAESFTSIFKKIVIYIIFFGSIFFIKDIKQLQKILAALIVFTAIISTIELIRFSIDYPSMTKHISAYRLEYYGFPITNGEIKMIILLIITPLFMVKKNHVINKVLLAICTTPLFVTFYLTNARNAVLGLFGGLIIIGLLKNKYFLIGLVAVTVLFLVFAPLPVKERIYSITDMTHPSNKSRIVMWETGYRMISDHLFFGTGDIDVNKIYRQYKTPEFHGEGAHMHNNLIQILLNFGIFGGLAWFALMIYIFIRQIKVYLKTRGNEFLSVLCISSIACMAAFQISGLTEWNFGDAEFAVVMWFSLSLAFLSEKFYSTNNG